MQCSRCGVRVVMPGVRTSTFLVEISMELTLPILFRLLKMRRKSEDALVLMNSNSNDIRYSPPRHRKCSPSFQWVFESVRPCAPSAGQLDCVPNLLLATHSEFD